MASRPATYSDIASVQEYFLGAAGVTLDGNNNVSEWLGQKLGWRVHQDYGPQYYPGFNNSAINGTPGLYFNGGQGLYTDAGYPLPSGSAPHAVLLSIQVNEAQSNQFALLWGNAAGQQLRAHGTDQGSPDFAGYGADYAAPGSIVGKAVCLLSTVTGGGSPVVTHWQDGANIGSAAVSGPLATPDNTQLQIGGAGNVGNLLRGVLQQIVIFNAIPTTAERQMAEGIESWTTGKNGVNLPADHPYKNSAPVISTGGGTVWQMSASGRSEYAGNAVLRSQVFIRPTPVASEYIGTTKIQKLGLIRALGATEFSGSTAAKSQTSIRAQAVTEYSGRVNATQRYGLRAKAVTEYVGTAALKAQRSIRTQGAEEFAGQAQVKVLQSLRTTAATSEMYGRVTLRASSAIRPIVSQMEMRGTVVVQRAQLIYTRAQVEFVTSARVTFTVGMRPRAALEYAGRAGILVQAKADNRSIYGNPASPYGYGPYGVPNDLPIAPAGADEFYGSTEVIVQAGYQPAIWYAVREGVGRVDLRVWVPLRPQRASLAFSGRVTAVLQVPFRSRASFELYGRTRVAVRYGMGAIGSLSLVTRLQMSYAWSDLGYPSRPVAGGSWGDVVAPVDPWQNVASGTDPWQTARPAVQK